MDITKLTQIANSLDGLSKIVIHKVRNGLTRTYKMPISLAQLKSVKIDDEINEYSFDPLDPPVIPSESESESTPDYPSHTSLTYDDNDFTVIISRINEPLTAHHSLTDEDWTIYPNSINLIPSGISTLSGNPSEYTVYNGMEAINVPWNFQNHYINYINYNGDYIERHNLIKSYINENISFVDNDTSEVISISQGNLISLIDEHIYTIQCNDNIKIISTGFF